MSNLFQINGVWLYPPDGYQEAPVPVIGYNLKGEPIRQGYPSIVFSWQLLKQEQMTALMDAYDPENPQALFQFISRETGALTSKYGMMEEPIVGARFIIYYQNVQLKVTRITETP